jgi:hypothetical protein
MPSTARQLSQDHHGHDHIPPQPVGDPHRGTNFHAPVVPGVQPAWTTPPRRGGGVRSRQQPPAALDFGLNHLVDLPRQRFPTGFELSDEVLISTTASTPSTGSVAEKAM